MPNTILDTPAMDDRLRIRARASRAEIAAGALRGEALRARILSVPFRDRDAWLDEVLGLEPPPPDDPDLPRGAVPYLPCGVEEILAFVRDARLGPADELVDLGSGVGRAVLLAHLLSGAGGLGIEIQEHLVARARALSEDLGITRVSFLHADATRRALDGTHFFLYAPCNGAMLSRLLERIAEVACRRPLVIATVGLDLDEPWLSPQPSSCRALSLYVTRRA